MMRMKLIGIFTALFAVTFLLSDLRESYGAVTGESQFLKNIRQLTYEGKRAGEGYFSEDGKALIFQSEREPENPFFQIYLLSLETGDTHRVSPGTGKTTCSFCRPGTNEALFASTHLDPGAKAKQQAEIEFRATGKERRFTWDYDERYDIFSAQRDGSKLKQLTNTTGYDAEGAYSPDGAKIVFCSLRDAYPLDKLSPEERKQFGKDPAYFGEIYIMNADGSDQKRLTNWPGYDGGPFFSPDGERIIWRHFNENGMLADVYTMRLDGSDIRRLTDFGSMSWAPYFHPSGEYVIFHSNKFGFANCELFIVDNRGEKEPVRGTFTDKFDGLPVFSPDGKLLSWTSNRTLNGNSQLFMAEWDHDAAMAAIKASPARQASQPAQIIDIPKGSEQDTTSKPSYSKPVTGGTETHFSPEITADDFRTEVKYIASDELEGRMTGSRGTQMASDYIVAYFKEIGLKAIGGNGSYFQEFPFTSGVKIVSSQNHLQIRKEGNEKETTKFEVNKDFTPLSFTANGEVEGQVVFAGYGLIVPGNNGVSYDSYAGLNVKDKIVLVLNYLPEEVDMKRRQELNLYAGLRYKALLARERGAKAIVVINGPKSTNAGELIPLSFDKAAADSGIIAASISMKAAETLFAGSGKDLATIQSQLDKEERNIVGSFDLPNVHVNISAVVERQKKTDRNVLGLLPPMEGTENPEYVMVGAHYDHIGHGEIDSLARKGEEGQVHNGADDNASGVSTVLELAASLAKARNENPQNFRRGIVFVLWSGEEMGIIGSSYFAKHPAVSLKNIAAYINFDMVGRLKENRLVLQGMDSSEYWTKLVEKRNVAAGFNLVLQHDPYLPTDTTALYPEGIPVMNFFTGSHEDYNRPTDDPETLNYDGLVRIAKFAQSMIIDLAKSQERPAYAKVERKGVPSEQHGSQRAYLGTVPDFSSENIVGIKIGGIKADGPADKAGFKEGDIIVEFAGLKITNIYDYKYALDTAKIGKPVEVVVLRNGNRHTLTVVPESKK
ncbi:MAG: M28 family peptidase [Candidatus Brocadiaceae bacterium]|nr:M28 family peptidase [Candidatus Brocadiaceae bacterium]